MTRDLKAIAPKTIEGIKSLAKSIKKAHGVPHHEALNTAAKQAGFANFHDAHKALGAKP